ncbi:type II secretion system F family protein [Aquifex sp.]
MKTFYYEGLQEGRRVKGTLRAKDRREAIAKLKREGIKLLKLKEGRELTLKLFQKKIPEEEIAFSLIQLSTLLSSGIPLTRALELLARQTENEELSSAFIRIKKGIEKGESLQEAFSKAGVFPEFLPEMLSAVQRGENLEYIFQVAGEYLYKVSEFKSKVLSSVTYPAVIITFSFISLFIAVKFVVPKIAGVLEGFGKELPLVTKLIILFANLLSYLLFALPVLLILFKLRSRFVSKEKLHYYLLKLPVLGKLNLYFNLSRFARVLSMLLKAAVPLDHALELSVKSISNHYLREKLEEIIPEVKRGKSLSSLLKKIPEIPEMFKNLVETGESSGELERMLGMLSELYEKQAERTINFWLRMVEPAAILLIGIIVGIIVVSVILPLTEITTGFGK